MRAPIVRSTSSGTRDLFSGIAALTIAGLALIEARTFPLQSLEDGLGAAFFPFLTLGAIAILGIALVASGLAQGVRLGTPSGAEPSLIAAAKLFLAFGAFAVAFAHLGLLGPAIVFLIAAMRILGAPWIGAVIVGLAAGCGLYALFVIGFGVPMP